MGILAPALARENCCPQPVLRGSTVFGALNNLSLNTKHKHMQNSIIQAITCRGPRSARWQTLHEVQGWSGRKEDIWERGALDQREGSQVHWAAAWLGSRMTTFRPAVSLGANIIHLVNQGSFTRGQHCGPEKDLSNEKLGNGTAPRAERNSRLEGWPNSQGKLAGQLKFRGA